MKIGDVYYEKHTVVGISKRTNTVSETEIEIVNMIDVLDKIRAEIKHHSEHFINDDGDDCLAVYEDDVLEIIDKYKAETEAE